MLRDNMFATSHSVGVCCQVIKAKDADYPERMATIRGAVFELQIHSSSLNADCHILLQ